MLDQSIREYAKEKGFHSQTLERWLRLPAADREALFELTQTLKLGENHFRDFLDWLEEISVRDGVAVHEVVKGESFSRILSDPRLGRADKLKCVKEELRRLRFPRLSRIEKEIQKKIRELRLSARIQVSVPPSLEGGALTVQIKAASHEELRRLVKELEGTLERDGMREIFVLLSGKGDDAGLSA
ncbi:MAG: hypothetical protein ACREP8_02270 [Candidatus Binatia bacterium]